MRKTISILILCLLAINIFSQSYLRTKDFNFEPSMDQNSEGIWGRSYYKHEVLPKNLIAADSMYIVNPGLPDFSDISVPDLEMKVKSLWHGTKVYFLFQRLDDIWVTGYNADNSVDTTVKEGLENKDATAIFLYLSTDSARTTSTFNYSDSIAWIRFVWKTNDVMARLPSGDTVNSYAAFHSESTQWCDDIYCYAKIAIDLGELAPYVTDSISRWIKSVGYATIGLNIELDENDKEDGISPYGIQTRAFMNFGMGNNALDKVQKWRWLLFDDDTLVYEPTAINVPEQYITAMYPNPANSFITIKLEEYKEVNYSLVDLSGRMVLTGYFEGNEQTIPLLNLTNGMYLLQLTDRNSRRSVGKIMVVH